MKNAGTFLTELQSGALNGRMIEIYGCGPDKAQGYADRFAKVTRYSWYTGRTCAGTKRAVR